MEIKSRRKLGIFLSALVFVGNYLPWVRQAASLPDTLTLSSGQIHLIQTGLPMYASVQGEAVSVMASQDERIGVALNARQGGETSVTFSLLGLIPVHETRVNVVEERMLIPGGQAVGVALKTRGVLVVSGSSRQRGGGLKTGDVILSAEGQAVLSTKELAERVGNAEGETVRMEILRAGQKLIVDVSAPVDESDGKRRLGVWVRDSTAGVGTLTYIDPKNGAYGALGHAIVDGDTGRILDAREGAILRASVVGVTRGQNGRAGELKGSFLKEGTQIGSLLENGEYGIYGVMAEGRGDALYPQGLPVGTRDTVHVGAASILATVGFGCSVEVVKEDGNIVNVMSEEDTRRVRTAAQSAVSSVKDAVHFEKVVDQTTEATWTVPEEETPEAPEAHTEVHTEEHHEE